MKKLVFIFIMGLTLVSYSQNYYSVIISGGGPIYEGKEDPKYDAFWNDASKFWEFCGGHYFTDVIVFYDNGNDAVVDNSNYQHTPDITRYPADLDDINSVLDDLANTLSYNDILAVYLLGHGGIDEQTGSWFLSLQYQNEKLYDTDIEDWVKAIPCKKRVVIVSSCYSGGLKDNFQDYKTIFLSSSDYDEDALFADDDDPDDEAPYIDALENEEYQYHQYSHHGEFDYHFLNGLFQSTIYYENPVASDLDDNEEISVEEMFSFAQDRNSTSKTPQYYCYGDLGAHTYINAEEDIKWENTAALDVLNTNPNIVWGNYPDEGFGTISKYRIYRSVSTCGGYPTNLSIDQWIGTTTSSVFQFTDNSGTTGSDYIFKYKIKAVNSSNQLSDYSNEVSVCRAIDWSEALFITINSGTIRLAWTPYGNTTINGYYIYRKQGINGTFSRIDEVGSNVFEYNDPNYSYDPNGLGLYYYVTAHLSPSGESSATNTVSTTGIHMDKQSSTGEIINFVLENNYPNPFNPSTRIDYSLRLPSQVILEVYNIYGSRVAVLVDEYKKEGTYSVNFNAGNLASGVYFYKLQAGEFISTKKMTLLK